MQGLQHMTPSTPATPTRGVNHQYFKRLLHERHMSQRRLADLMEMDQASLVRSFQGKRRFQAHETTTLARLLNVPLEEILRHLGVEVPTMRIEKGGKIAVAGQVLAGKVQYGRAPGPRSVAVPPNKDGSGLMALRYSDEGPLEGAYIYYRPSVDVQPDAIGKLCVCALAGGDTVLAAPTPSGRAAYTLRDLSGRVIHDDAWLESAAPVVWINTR